MPQKAFIGEPADEKGNAIPGALCDRRARHRVKGEPRCMVHITLTMPADQAREVAAARRAKLKERLERR